MLEVDDCLCSTWVCLYVFILLQVSLLAFCALVFFGLVWLTSAVVLQFRVQASFISYTGVTAFLIFQTNGHVSIAACQFWFYDSFIIKCVRLQCSAADGLLHFSHGQGMSPLYVYAGRRGRMCACTCVCMFTSRHGGFQVCPSRVRADVSWPETQRSKSDYIKCVCWKAFFIVVCLIDLSLVTSV